MNRNEFINKFASEKIAIAHVHGRERILPWTLYDETTIYSTSVDYFVVSLHNELVELTSNSDYENLSSGEYYYDTTTNIVYVNIEDDPNDHELIATYRFFYSTAPIDIPWNLIYTGSKVNYTARILTAPQFSHEIGVEQDLISIIGTGQLKLINVDRGLDDIFERVIFDNQSINVYTWNRELPISDARIVYTGIITSKKFDSDNIQFSVRDELVRLGANFDLSPYGDSETVADSIKSHYKRQVYGRVDGLKLQSIDQVANGYSLVGTVSATPASNTITGSGTAFLSQLAPDDKITIDTQEFTIESIESNTSLTATSPPDFTFVDRPYTVLPDRPYYNKNRHYFVADHACARITKTLIDIKQLNRVQLNDTNGLIVGDFIQFDTDERIQIKSFSTDNVVVLVKNLVTFPTINSDVTRQPIQKLYINGVKVLDADFNINNEDDTVVTLSGSTEFNLTSTRDYNISMTFTNGSRSVTTAADIDLRDIFKSRDWIKPNDLSYTTYYEILSVSEQSLLLRTNFAQSTITETIQSKQPEYLDDNTIVSCDVLGKTQDGLPDGHWLSTAPELIEHLLLECGIDRINTESFTEGKLTQKAVLGFAVPSSPGSGETTYKNVIDQIARSTNSIITLDNNLDIKYSILNPTIPDTITEIHDRDLINWNIEITSGKNIRNSIVKYRTTDVDLASPQNSGAEVTTYTSQFVTKYVGTNLTEERTTLLYDLFDARIYARRLVCNQSVGRTDINITTDLRLENVQIGDVVLLSLNRLYKRLGSADSNKKLMFVYGKSVNSERVSLKLTDFGNMYNRSSIITPNDTPDFDDASEETRLICGFITDNQGIIDDNKYTANTHLIS